MADSPIKNMKYWKGKHQASEKSPLELGFGMREIFGKKALSMDNRRGPKPPGRFATNERRARWGERQRGSGGGEGGGENEELITLLQEEDDQKAGVEEKNQDVEQAINARTNSKEGMV